jgi:hypothetical protein
MNVVYGLLRDFHGMGLKSLSVDIFKVYGVVNNLVYTFVK